MTTQTTTPDPTPDHATREDLRADMHRMLDELVTARADRAKALEKEFKALWTRIGEPSPTIH